MLWVFGLLSEVNLHLLRHSHKSDMSILEVTRSFVYFNAFLPNFEKQGLPEIKLSVSKEMMALCVYGAH